MKLKTLILLTFAIITSSSAQDWTNEKGSQSRIRVNQVLEAISKLNTIGLTSLGGQEYSQALEDQPQLLVECYPASVPND